MFIKRSEGKITSIIEGEEELSEKQKQAFDKVSKSLPLNENRPAPKKVEE